MKGENKAVGKNGRGEKLKAETGADTQLGPWIEKIGWLETRGQMFKR